MPHSHLTISFSIRRRPTSRPTLSHASTSCAHMLSTTSLHVLPTVLSTCTKSERGCVKPFPSSRSCRVSTGNALNATYTTSSPPAAVGAADVNSSESERLGDLLGFVLIFPPPAANTSDAVFLCVWLGRRAIGSGAVRMVVELAILIYCGRGTGGKLSGSLVLPASTTISGTGAILLTL